MRISYSLLSLWQKGDVEGAIKTYLHTNNTPNERMKQGKIIHKEIQDHIVKHNKFPDWFFKYEFTKPENEKEVVVKYNERFDLKAILDTYDTGIGFEYKTGTQDSLVWARSAQVPLYMLTCSLADIPVSKFYLMHWDQYRKERDYSLIWYNQEQIDKARNYIDSYAPEIYEYFSREGII